MNTLKKNCKPLYLQVVLFALIAAHSGCSGKKAPLDNNKCMFQNQTLSSEVGKSLSGDTSLPVDNALLLAAKLVVLAKANTADINNTFAQTLAEQLSLRCGILYSDSGAALLLKASHHIAAMALRYSTISQLNTAIDSLVAAAAPCAFAKGKPKADSDTSKLFNKQNKQVQEALQKVFQTNFYLSTQASNILYDFVFGILNPQASKTDTKSLINGLVASGAPLPIEKAKNQTPSQKPVATTKATSAELLKLRSMQSITDSISRHTNTIKALYKKELKRSSNLAGVVWVNFAISSDGTVASVSVPKTSISDEIFIKGLLVYLQTVKFQRVPESLGTMHFDFPFEFEPE